MAIKKGDTVRQILPAPITGTVIEKRFLEDSETFQYQVESPDTDGDGQPQTRWFNENEIQGV
jgi:hypothetical protein